MVDDTCSGYTNKEMIERMYTEARTLSDTELRRHYGVSVDNKDTCGTCFCCICGKVLEERKRGKS